LINKASGRDALYHEGPGERFAGPVAVFHPFQSRTAALGK
jgi:hypothetical protein